MMAEMCSCDFSLMVTAQATVGEITCTRCGKPWTRGGKRYVIDAAAAVKVRAFLERGGQIALVPILDLVAFTDPDAVIAAPGKAIIERCPDCADGADGAGYGGQPCGFCAGTGRQLWKACPRCGDTAMWTWAADRKSAHCSACSASWQADHPGWIAQRLPDRYLARRAGATG